MANATYSAISLRGRSSLPSPSNHCSCYFSKEFVYDNATLSLPMSPCCICSCSCSALTSSTAAHLAAPINPSFSCALRQSTLIQLSAPRKLFSSAARYRRYHYYRLPVYGPDRGCCELSCAEHKERGSLYRKVVAEEKSRRCGYRSIRDAEAVLSLLTEGMGVKECGNGVGERAGRVRWKGRGGHVGTSECHGGEKELGLSWSSEFKSCEVENRREEREAFTFTCTSSVDRGSSTCSSAYFSSSEEDFHSNAEVRVNDQRESVAVSLEECVGDVGGNGVGRFYENRKGEDEKCRDAAGVPGEQISGPRESARARTNDWDWRKNSEKKLTDVVRDEQKCTVEMAYRELSNTENGSNAVYHSQNCDRDDESNVEERARKQYAQIGIHGSGASESRRKYKQHAQVQEVSGHELRSTNIFQHKLNSGKENIGVAKNMSEESRKNHGLESNYISFQHESDRISHKHSTASEVHEQTSNLNRLSETLRKNQEKNATSVLDERTRNQGGEVAISESEVSESGKEYQQQLTEMQEASGHNLKLASLSQQNNLSQEAISQNAPEDSCQHDSVRNSQQVFTASEVHERTSELNKRSETLRKKRETNAALILNSNKEIMEQQSYRTSQRFVKKIDCRRKFQQSTKVLNYEGLDIEHASSSQRQPDPMVSNREENLNLVFSSLSEPEQQCFQSDRQAIKRTIFKKGSQAGIKSHGISMGMNTEERYLAPVDGARSQLGQTNRSVLHIVPRIETQKPSKLSNLHEPTSSKAFGIQVPLDLEAQVQAKQIGLKETICHRRSQTIMMPPQSQLVTRGGSETQECPRKIPGSGMRDPGPQGMKLDLQMELQDKSRRDTSGEPLKCLSHEDFMSSASHQDESSMEFVGDYVENIESEVIASEIQGEQKVYESNLVYRSKEHKQKGLGKHGPSNFHSKKSDSKHSSVDFGTKGPSSSMLDVVDPAFLEVSETGASEGTTTDKNCIVKRPSRSLWNIVRDVFRLRWGSNGDTHNFGGKFGAKSSSDESLCSEAWFSGLEPDKKNEEIMRRKPRVPTSEKLQPTVTPGQSQRYSSDTKSSKDDETRYFEADIPSSSSVLQSRSGSRGKSPASGYESTDRSEDGKSLRRTPSMANPVLVESSILLPSKGTRSPVVSEISDTGITEKMQQPVNTRLIEGLGTVGKDMGLNRSKLQRKDQVMKDTFDEWEEAYKMESKQRKIDEGFMREAILEAKKAADCWEVPVGAVLVRHGNVIARGCNLVEELRDSTAHAEMICIREASNVLRSWRLADTTLYVTLEPCPMCAGAILQSRIKTVVWGTPNKLLGADGSWIRLFPDGGEAGNALGQTDKPAAPVHPFHPNMTVRRGVLAAECADAMQHFFQLRRRKKEKKLEPPTLCPIVRHPSNFFSKMHHILHIIFCL